MTTVDIKYEINDLVCEDKESFSDIIICQICMDTFINKQIYQCKEGHFACLNCWKIILSSNKSDCFSCRKKIGSFNELSRNRGIELMISNMKVNCPYAYSNIIDISNSGIDNKEEEEEDDDDDDDSIGNNINGATIDKQLTIDSNNGCKEKIKIEQLDSHILECKFKFVQCNNYGCNYIGRLNEYYGKHQNECKYLIVECNSCKEMIKKCEMNQHVNLKCPYVLIECHQCNQILKRDQLNHHIDKECPNTIIRCKYSKYCKDEFKRSELSIHLKQVNHSESMKNIIEEKEKEIEQYQNELKQANERCNNLVKNFGIIDRVLTSFEKVYSNKWEITQFNEKIKHFGVFDSIFSSIIKIGPYKFYLGLSLTGIDGYNNEDTDHLSIYVYNYNNEDGPISIQCEFEVINHIDYLKNKKIKFIGQYENPIDDQDLFIEQVLLKLSNISKTSGFISKDNDTLIINFTITLTNISSITPLRN